MPRNSKFGVILPMAGLIAITLAVFTQIIGHKFVYYDDQTYIVKNPHIQHGLSLGAIKWAFAGYACNWHPLTWISHTIDYSLFGMNAGGHHAVSLLFHLANVLLLFVVLRRMTGSIWKSAFVAALFAIHPLHVESVAWAAERKDVLSTFFGLLTMLAYMRYADFPSARKYVLVAFLFALALMSKAMLVTLPFILLMLDFWPLGRVAGRETSVVSAKERTERKRYPISTLVLEKLPLLVLSLAAGLITNRVQTTGVLQTPLEHYPLTARIDDVIVGYVGYLIKTFYPAKLAVYYPPPGTHMPAWWVVASIMLLVGITLASILLRRRTPYLFVGWLWYAVSLSPVIGQILNQVGDQSIADRFTYIPLIGIFIAVTWGIPDILGALGAKNPGGNKALIASSCVIVLLLTSVAYRQAACWENSITLFAHAADVTTNSSVAEVDLGTALITESNEPNHLEDGIAHLGKAIRIKPKLAMTYNIRGVAYAQLGKLNEAASDFRTAISLDKDLVQAYNNLGNILREQKDYAGAEGQFRKAIKLNPKASEPYHNLGRALADKKRFDAAIGMFRKSIELEPGKATTHTDLADALTEMGRYDEAVRECEAASRIDPRSSETYGVMARAWFMLDDYRQAWESVKKMEELGGSPDSGFLAKLAAKMPQP